VSVFKGAKKGFNIPFEKSNLGLINLVCGGFPKIRNILNKSVLEEILNTNSDLCVEKNNFIWLLSLLENFV
jgi:hypothetical protein